MTFHVTGTDESRPPVAVFSSDRLRARIRIQINTAHRVQRFTCLASETCPESAGHHYARELTPRAAYAADAISLVPSVR